MVFLLIALQNALFWTLRCASANASEYKSMWIIYLYYLINILKIEKMASIDVITVKLY